VSQLGLFDRPAPYVRVSETSRAAATSIEPVSGTLRAIVLAFVRGRGTQGATCDEVEIALGMKHQTASARIRELAQAKLIRQASERRATSSGRSAAVWRTA
jgi:hypothetical protein